MASLSQPVTNAAVRPSAQAEAPPSKKGAPGAAPGHRRHGRARRHADHSVRAGHRRALATVAIKPRVDGQVVEVGFKEGDLVQAGSMLYRLDDRLVRAQIRQAEATDRQGPGVAEGRDVDLRAPRGAVPEEVRQRGRDRDRAPERRGAAGQHCRRPGAARDAAHPARLSRPSAPRSPAAPAASPPSSARSCAAPIRSPLVTINQTKPITVAFALPQISLQQLKSALASQGRGERSRSPAPSRSRRRAC